MDLRVHRSKYLFFQPSIEYLRHVTDSEGLHKAPSKVMAIMNAPAPQNVSKLHPYLGLLNYYWRFSLNLYSLLKPLYQLLCHGRVWKLTDQCENASIQTKTASLESDALIHFDPTLPIQLACDVSSYSVGAVVSLVRGTLSKQICNICLEYNTFALLHITNLEQRDFFRA